MQPDSAIAPKPTLVEILYVIFLRGVAVTCFWFGLQYWAMLIGYSLDGAARFDLLPAPWRLAASTLAVLFPVASLGLWLTAPWGSVLWAIAAAAQITMYMGWPDIFGENRIVPLMHALVAALYAIFRICLWRQNHLKRERVRLDSP